MPFVWMAEQIEASDVTVKAIDPMPGDEDNQAVFEAGNEDGYSVLTRGKFRMLRAVYLEAAR